MKNALTLILVVLAACSSPATTGGEADATATPGRYTDAEQAELLAESIEIVYAGEPQPDWYSAFVGLEVEDRWAYVNTTLTEAEADLADSMCRDIAAVTFDDDAEPIGVTDVLIYGDGGADLVDCDVPER